MGSYDYAGHQIIEKGGALAGVRTILVLVPDKNAGIVVLANLNLTAFPEAVRAYFLNQLLGLDPEAGQKEIFADNEKLKNCWRLRRRQRIREIQRHAAIAGRYLRK